MAWLNGTPADNLISGLGSSGLNDVARWSLDSSGNPIGLEGPDSLYATAGIVPETNDSVGIQAAIDAAYAAGGGVVSLLPVTYTFTAQVVLRSGVHVVGQRFVNTITSNVPEDTEVLASGTICEGDSTFPGFVGNAEDQASATTSLTASGSTGARGANQFAANALQNVEVSNLALRNFTYGIKVGALNNMGLLKSRISNIYTLDCVNWGVSLDNFQFCVFEEISGKTTLTAESGCIRLGCAVDSSVLIPGDSYARNLWGTSTKRLGRPIAFETHNSVTNNLHNLNIVRIQANKLSESSVYDSVTVNNSANIPATHCEYFPVGMPVWFLDSAGADFTYTAGFNTLGAKQIYFVVSRSASSGAGDVQVSNTYNGTAITTTGGSVTLRMTTGGYAGVEVRNKSGNYLAHANISGIACEGINNPSIVLHSVSGGRLHVADHLSTAVSNIVARGAIRTVIESTCASNYSKTDFDSASADVIYIGNRATSGGQVGVPGYGFWNHRLVTQYDPTVAGVTGVAASRIKSGSNSAQIQLVVTGPATGAICVVTLSTLTENYSGYCPTIQPANAAAQALSGANQVRVQGTCRTTGFDIEADTALPNGTYLYNVRW